jgi:release factor glutamine methyltransferase
MTFIEAAGKARAVLVAAGLLPQTAALDADLLARSAAGWDTATWLMRRGEVAPPEFLHTYEQLIARRVTREPVAYIRGVQEFFNREFAVSSAVLIPRPETELLVESALGCLASSGTRVVDVGTGSGCIAVTLALERAGLHVIATDVSAPALAVAKRNAARHRVSDRVHFVRGEYAPVQARSCELIVSNPPYVAGRDRAGLAPEVREHEPGVALFGGEDGWRDIRALFRVAAWALTDTGRLLIEIGFGQSERIAQEVRDTGVLELHQMRADLQGIPRVAIIARRAGVDPTVVG